MAAYAALLSLARTTHLYTNQHDQSLFSSDALQKLQSINNYVRSLLSFFEESSHKVSRWEGRIRRLAYEIEDIIELFIWQRIRWRHGVMMVKLGDQLKNATEEIGFIAGAVMEERPQASLPASSSSRLPTAGKDAVIGLDDDFMAIKDRLCGESPTLQVIPIVGMGGIGKSTLARTLYEDQLIIRNFDVLAWVVASQDYNPHSFKRNLLDSIKSLEHRLDSLKLSEKQVSGDMMDESDIGVQVVQNLKGRRYLVVIDDVWGKHFWDDVMSLFPDDNNGSRIVLTSRQLDVANSPAHEMGFLNDVQSWHLLKKKLFGNGNFPSELEVVGREIARRCGGLPLALVLVAGVLSQGNKTRAFWVDIARNVNPVVGREIEEILSLSYTYLPHYLRPCFLFIGGFQEDANIRASRLVRLWLAEGFVKHEAECRKSLEEVAEEYLEDLVKRNLVIVTSRKINGKIKSFCFHDMVRELCKRKAREEKFLHVMDGRDLPQGLMDERGISFSRSDVGLIWGSTFRTILCFQVMDSFPGWLGFVGNYKLLRVLDVLGVDLKQVPSQVFELYHLRYLALMGCLSIPSAVSNLVNLQTLIIHLGFEKEEMGRMARSRFLVASHSLPLEIWRMPKLRHIFLLAPFMLPHPLEGLIRPLENLQTLLLVKDLVWNESILRMIPNVKKLGLTCTFDKDYHLRLLRDLHHLEKLEVMGYLDFSWTVQSLSFPRTLKKLTLVRGRFPWKDMAIVGLLPNLEVLKLLDNACVGETWETADGEFPQLKVLVIDESPLKKLITHSFPFPRLKRLVLRSCQYLMEIPGGVGEIPTLELIEVDRCTESLVESAEKIKENRESFGYYDLQVRAGQEVRVRSELPNFRSYLRQKYPLQL